MNILLTLLIVFVSKPLLAANLSKCRDFVRNEINVVPGYYEVYTDNNTFIGLLNLSEDPIPEYDKNKGTLDGQRPLGIGEIIFNQNYYYKSISDFHIDRRPGNGSVREVYGSMVTSCFLDPKKAVVIKSTTFSKYYQPWYWPFANNDGYESSQELRFKRGANSGQFTIEGHLDFKYKNGNGDDISSTETMSASLKKIDRDSFFY